MHQSVPLKATPFITLVIEYAEIAKLSMMRSNTDLFQRENVELFIPETFNHLATIRIPDRQYYVNFQCRRFHLLIDLADPSEWNIFL